MAGSDKTAELCCHVIHPSNVGSNYTNTPVRLFICQTSHVLALLELFFLHPILIMANYENTILITRFA
jgi:hypothetical protein